VNSDGSFSYAPSTNYNGPDSFMFTVDDGHGGNDTGLVSITVSPVNDAPVAGNDGAETPENHSVVIHVLTNDTDVDGDVLSISEVVQASHGGVGIGTGNTNVVYTPATNYNGPDGFSYVVSDGNGGFSTGIVNVTVTPQEPVGALTNVTTNVVLVFTWQCSQHTCALSASLQIANLRGSRVGLSRPFLLALHCLTLFRFLNPNSTMVNGVEYLDITDKVLSALSQAGNTDSLLDPGESITIEDIRVNSRSGIIPPTDLFEFWAYSEQ
jgi:hypothetical protein